MKTVLFLLGELDDDDIDWMIETGNRKEVPDGTVLINEGRPIENLYILLEGTLGVSIAALQGREIANLLSGDIVGEMSFVDTRPPSATVTAKGDALVLAISRDQLAAKLKLDVGFAARFYRALAISLSNRLRLSVNRMEDRSGSPSAELSTDGLGQEVKDSMQLAKTRLDWLLRRLEKGEEEMDR